MIASASFPFTLQCATVWDVSHGNGARLSSPPAAHVGKLLTCLPLELETLYPALRAHNVAIMLAHFPAALARVSFNAAIL